MKKVLYLSVLTLLMCTACGKKNFSCSMEQTVSDNTVINTVEASFKGKKLSSTKMIIETKLSDEYTDYIDVFEKDLETYYKQYKDKNGIKMDINSSGNVVRLEITIDINKVSDKDKKELGMTNSNVDYKSSKKSFESMGYTCK